MKRVVFLIIFLLSLNILYATETVNEYDTSDEFDPANPDWSKFDPSTAASLDLSTIPPSEVLGNWDKFSGYPNLQAQLTAEQLSTVLSNPSSKVEMSGMDNTKIQSIISSTYSFSQLSSFSSKNSAMTLQGGVLTAGGKTFNVANAAQNINGPASMNVLADGTVQITTEGEQTIDPAKIGGESDSFEINAQSPTQLIVDGEAISFQGSTVSYENGQIVVSKATTFRLESGKDVSINPIEPVSLNGNLKNNVEIRNDNLGITSSGKGFEMAYVSAYNQKLPYYFKGDSEVSISNLGSTAETVNVLSNSEAIGLGSLIVRPDGRILTPANREGFVAPAKTTVLKNGQTKFGQEYTWNGVSGQGRIKEGFLDIQFDILASDQEIATKIAERLSQLTPAQIESLGLHMGNAYMKNGQSRAGSKSQAVIARARAMLGKKTDGAHCTAAIMQLLYPGSKLGDGNPAYSDRKTYEAGSRFGAGSGKYVSAYRGNSPTGDSSDVSIITPGTHAQFTTSSSQGSHSELVTDVQSAGTIMYNGKEYATWKVTSIGAFNGGATKKTYSERTRYITTAPVTSNNHHYNGGQKYSVLLRAQQTDTASQTYTAVPTQPTQAQYQQAAQSFLSYNLGSSQVASSSSSTSSSTASYRSATSSSSSSSSSSSPASYRPSNPSTFNPPAAASSYDYAYYAPTLASSYDDYDFWNSQFPRPETDITTYAVRPEDFVASGITQETPRDDDFTQTSAGQQIVIEHKGLESPAQIRSIQGEVEPIVINGQLVEVTQATIQTYAGQLMVVYLIDQPVPPNMKSTYPLVEYKGTLLV